MTPTPPTVTLVDLDETDDNVEAIRYLNALNDPDGGRVLLRVHYHKKRRNTYTTASQVMVAAGARNDVTGVRDTAEANWRYARAWYTTLGVSELVVTNANLLPPRHLADLLEFAADIGAELVLVREGASSPQWNETVDEHDPTPVGVGELLDRYGYPDLPEPSCLTGTAARLPEWLALPSTGFLSFRDDVHRLCHPAWVARIDEVWREAAAASVAWVDEAAIGDETVATHLHGLLDGCATRPEMLVSARALEVVLFARGWWSMVDVDTILNSLDLFPTFAQRSPAALRRLRAYRQTWRTGAMALYLAGVPVGTQLELRVGDVSGDGAHVALPDGSKLEVEETLRPFVEALVRTRQLAEAADADALLVWEDEQRPVNESSLSKALQAPAAEVGVPVVTGLAATNSTRGMTVPPSLIKLKRVAEYRLPVNPSPPTDQGEPAAGPAEVSEELLDPPVLDGQLLRRRRVELDISAHDLGKRIGVRGRTISHIEETGGGNQLTVNQLVRLVRILAVDADELVLRDRPNEGRDVDDAQRGDANVDAAALGPMLLAARSMVHLELIAEEYGWTLCRVDRAVEALDRLLKPAGLRAHRVGGRVSIQPAVETATVEERRETLKRHRARHAVLWPDAKALASVLVPDEAAYRGKPGTKRVAMHRLRNGGHVTDDGSDQPTDGLLHSLGIEDVGYPGKCSA